MGQKTYLVSRKGLTRCPKCARHIFLADNWTETRCGFCEAQLVAGRLPAEVPALVQMPSGRSNLIAAGLMSLSLGVSGCMDDAKNPTTKDSAMATPDMSVVDMAQTQPLYGNAGPDAMPATPDAGMATDATPDVRTIADSSVAQPLYGAAGPDDASTAADAAAPDMRLAPDVGAQPEYGAPPEDDE